MGWKSVKQHYKISHYVQVNERGMCIGSAYISDILVINPSGNLIKRYDRFTGSSDDLISRYQREMDADPDMLQRLVLAADTFEQSIAVFTWKGADIIEKQCEVLGWPNVTHDGEMMYENRFSPDRSQVLMWAKNDAKLAVKYGMRDVVEAENALAGACANLGIAKADLAKLEAQKDRE